MHFHSINIDVLEFCLFPGQLRAGFDLVLESLNLMNSVYGAVHSDMAQCMRLLARLSYILGDPSEALSQQHKATLMSERCNGLDNANTVIEYVSFLSLFLLIHEKYRLSREKNHFLGYITESLDEKSP